jgi:hypothetical protein
MLWGKPSGYVLRAKDGRIPSKISERLIPDGTQVIVHNGLVYVNTEERDEHDFEIFEEGFLTHVYVSPND